MGAIAFISAVAICGAVFALTNWWDNKKESYIESDPKFDETTTGMNKDRKVNTLTNIHKGTRDLFLETLTKIGCQYELGESDDDDKIYFAYQGENFIADANNEGWYVHIWDPCWEHVELYDIDELSRLRKAINQSNLNCATTTVFTIDEAGHTFDVHCKAVIPVISQIPEIENYLRVELNDFFQAHQYVSKEVAKQREAEKA